MKILKWWLKSEQTDFEMSEFDYNIDDGDQPQYN